jgi:hypothetical protein
VLRDNACNMTKALEECGRTSLSCMCHDVALFAYSEYPPSLSYHHEHRHRSGVMGQLFHSSESNPHLEKPTLDQAYFDYREG